MIKEFIEKWEQNKDKLYDKFLKKAPESYDDIVKEVILMINPKNKNDLPSPEKITCCPGMDYQGTNLYIIRCNYSYHEEQFWYIYVAYGSCSGCDAMQQIDDSNDSNEQKAKDYLTLAMHIVQSLKYIEEKD
jgi:hypothetical protein